MIGSGTRVELHHSGQICDRLYSRKRQNYADELDPKCPQTFVSWFEKMRREIRHTDSD